ncbi:MAG: hypothetical protein AAF297_05345 [Planctomycetota bacterium]
MRLTESALRYGLVCGAVCCGGLSVAAFGQESSLVFPGASGQLIYATQADGDRILDFSEVGYKQGREPIPTGANAVPMVFSVAPGPGDDTGRIQTGIFAASLVPMNANGFRGAVVLEPGEYQVSSQIVITTSGVVLRGAGDDEVTGTTIRATGTTQRSVIVVDSASGSGSGSGVGPVANVVDTRVPVGATSFRVDDAGLFTAGDRVRITRPGTEAWVSALGMDQIPPRADGNPIVQWSPGSYNLTFERTVTRVEGDRVFFDAPLSNALDERYGGGTIQRFSFANRVTNVGIEGLRGVSDYDLSDPEDEDHAWTFVEFRRVEDGWIRDVTGQHFGFATALVNESSRRVTVEDAVSLDPVSIVTGGRRYAFNISRAELVLMRDLFSEDGRHDFVFNSRSQGPNAFVNATASNAFSDTGPHQRWSTGGLFDNIVVDGDRINARNRGNFGSGHGWAGANMVVWNSVADGYIVESPQTAQNWLVGSVGPIINDTRFGQQPPGIVDAHGSPVATQSLHAAQVTDRDSAPNRRLFEYVLGDYDDYDNDGAGSVDDAPTTPSFDAAFGGYLSTRPTMGFDDTTNDQWVPLAFTFGVDPGDRVYRAVLTVAMKRTGGRTRNDSLWYESLDNRLVFDVDLGLTDELDNNESTVVAIEFAGVDALWLDDGAFDVLIGEDVAVDWARLDIFAGTAVPGDINADAAVDEADLAAFLELADAGDPRAERTGDEPASVDFFDVLGYLREYDAAGN